MYEKIRQWRADTPGRRSTPTMGDILGHALGTGPHYTNRISAFQTITERISQRLSGRPDPWVAQVREVDALQDAFDAIYSVEAGLKASGLPQQQCHFRALLKPALDLTAEGDLSTIPFCDIPEPQVVHKCGSFADAIARYDCSASQKSMVQVVARLMIEALSGHKDLGRVSPAEAHGVGPAFADHLNSLVESRDLKKATADKYVRVGAALLDWMSKHVHGCRHMAGALHPEHHAMLEWLKDRVPNQARHYAGRLFRWLAANDISLAEFQDSGEEFTRRFVEEDLRPGGIQAWRQMYNAAMRAVGVLQSAGHLSDFPVYRLGPEVASTYGIDVTDVGNEELERRCKTYFDAACDEGAFDNRYGRVVSPSTRDGLFATLGRYLGHLQSLGVDLQSATVDEVFSRDRLKTFARFLVNRSTVGSASPRTGVQVTLSSLNVIARELLHEDLPVDQIHERFRRLVVDDFAPALVGDRVPGLDEVLAIIRRIEDELMRPQLKRHNRLALERLRVMLIVFMYTPIPLGLLCKMRMPENLEFDALNQRWRVRFTPEEWGASRGYSCLQSEYGSQMLDTYLANVRPKLLACVDEDPGYVFSTTNGTHVNPDGFTASLKQWQLNTFPDLDPSLALNAQLLRKMVQNTCIALLGNRGTLTARTMLGVRSTPDRARHRQSEARGALEMDSSSMRKDIERGNLDDDSLRRVCRVAARDPDRWRRFTRALKTAVTILPQCQEAA